MIILSEYVMHASAMQSSLSIAGAHSLCPSDACQECTTTEERAGRGYLLAKSTRPKQ